jgi:hypothetical protein
MANKKNRTHPLLILLPRVPPSEERLQENVQDLDARNNNDWERYGKSLHIREMLWPFAFLRYLEEMLKIIVSKTDQLRDQAKAQERRSVLGDHQ